MKFSLLWEMLYMYTCNPLGMLQACIGNQLLTFHCQAFTCENSFL